MSRYLDPKADVVFKKIFGEHPHLLKNFLNALLPLGEEEQIDSLEYLPAEQTPEIPIFKRSIVDVKCRDRQGRVFIVEMQMEWTLRFMQRILFNSAQAYIKQLRKGEHYASLCPVYGLGIINDIFEREHPEWYHHYKIVNIQRPEQQLKGLELVFLELPKFKPTTQTEKRLQALWIRFLSEVGETTKVISSDLLAVPEIQEACTLCEEAAYSEGELEAYHWYWDFVSTEKTSVSGHIAEGIEIGRKEGLEVGKRQTQLEIARQLLAYQFAIPGIAAVTGLSISDIEELRQSLTPLEPTLLAKIRTL